jgi:hypothetical protein
MQAGRSAFDIIEFTNCPSSNDKWADEVAKISVGDVVRIEGEYSKFSSDETTMRVVLCHISPVGIDER